MRSLILPLIILLLSVSALEVQAQGRRGRQTVSNFRGFKKSFDRRFQYTTIDIGVGAMNYFGDITPTSSRLSTDLKYTRPSFSLFVSRRMGQRFQPSVFFTFGTLRGDDFESADPYDDNGQYRYVRNLSFRNRIYQVGVRSDVFLYSNNGTYITRNDWNPYVFVGVSAIFHNPQGRVPEQDSFGKSYPQSGEWIDLEPLGTEGQYSSAYDVDTYSKTIISVPFGIGATFKLSNAVNIAVEFEYNWLFTDYIDDVSGYYVDLDKLNSDLARAMSYRSGELVSSEGETREFNALMDGTNLENVGGYQVYRGFGSRGGEGDFANKRGNMDDNDIFIVTRVRLMYILGAGRVKRSKFR
ncbi:hypothetical protein [Marinigracilibium pacificum]|uniref:Outer membrane protein with beta-barrel domain n=1 Tax=Marinigracilibium pacificum TaxID=2729599 RepID=A0A848J2R4_9BACT|nr:hypothetical protein [Marinigracilibium pacificum]NMM49795.1 hypothetical protein [Marinigracilibium pacificum]